MNLSRPTLLAITLLLGSRAAVPLASASTAADICAPSADPCVVSSAKTVTAGSILDFGARQLDVKPTGSITVSGGLLTIRAGSLRLESHARLLGTPSAGTSASIDVVTSGDISVETGGNGDALIDVSAGDGPGQIDLVAGGSITIAGNVKSDATTTQGSGGVVNLAADGAISVSGGISAKGGTAGLGGAITIRGASVSTAGSIRVDAGDGGDVDVQAVDGGLTAGGVVNAGGGGSFGDGGSVSLVASTDLTMNGSVLLAAAGSLIEGGGTGGDVSLEATAGSMSVTGTVDNHGAAPNGDGGETDVVAGLDFISSGTFLTRGNGGDSCGGAMDVFAGRQVSLLGKVDVSGGFCGGDFDAEGAAATVGSGADLSADAADVAGSLAIDAGELTVAGKIHATGTSSTGTGGFVALTACTLNVPSGASVKTDGDQGINLLQASDQLTIGGQLSSRPTGRNRLEYLDPAKPPITLGTASIQPARDCAPAPGCLTPTLLACAAAAVCGNGVREGGEDCDDGNTTACDGCSATCGSEGCGNGTIECGEECDDGPSNGGPGDPCDAACHVVQGANTIFVPSSHRGNGCMLEWALRSAPLAGFPPSTITCIDGDPDCDADGVTDGGCTFQAAACLNVTDVRIPSCRPAPVDFVNVRRPSATSPDDAVEAANAQTLVAAIEALGITVRSRRTVLQMGMPESRPDRCSLPVALRVPHPPGGVGRRLLSAGAEDTLGHSVSNRIVLACAPNPAVCGNGVREVGEQCDDGNVASCDGCSDTCRLERCGDGVVQCGEQCDDGADNGRPGARCTATCGEAPPANRIPAGRSSRDCLAEWSLASGQVATSRNGLPTTKQVCVDNDGTCDFDPTPGTCRFHLWVCLGADDARLGCGADAVASLDLVKPSAAQSASATARQALLGAFAQVTLPAGPGEVCSRRVDLDLPAGKTKLQVKAEARSLAGGRDRDTVKLICAPAASLAGR